MRRFWIGPHSLAAQMILSFVALVLLTATAAGLPAFWLVRGRLEDQAWAQVDQGVRAAGALYEARQSELAGLAVLTAQRPTLQERLEQGEAAALESYLHTLRAGMELDLVLLCDAGRREIVQTGGPISAGLCQTLPDGVSFHLEGASRQVWLLGVHPIGDEQSALGMVIVGLLLDDSFAVQMRAQTGLEHTLLLDGQPLVTSLSGDICSRTAGSRARGDDGRWTFSLEGRPFYALRLPLGAEGLEAEVSLAVSSIAAARRSLAWTLAGSILVTAVAGSVVVVLLARRIGRPLVQLAGRAAALRQGDLDRPVSVGTPVREVAQLSEALEGAREELRQSLVDLQRERAWGTHLLEAIVEGIVTLDRRGHVTFFSHGAERITGWQRKDVLGRSCDQVFKPLETDKPFSQLIPSPGRRQKILVELRDGRQAILAVTGARLLPAEAGDARVALVFRDVSEAEAVHRLLGHFLANVAHEFRTPLSALAASVELLMDQAPDLSADELEELLTSLHLGVLGLQTLIDNLLESASIEAGHFRVYARPSSLDDIFAEAIRTMQPLLDKRGQRLVIELPTNIPVVQVDPRRTVQVLVNLLSNASKYGPDDAEIEIGAATRGECVLVTVADSGPGVPLAYRADLFRRFVQPGLGNDKAQVGAGLGLSVVKAVVEAQGGEVGIDDYDGGGSVFWFTLPRQREP
jgi:PAS domain S-box-containing protein